jgi:hypothetical protein
MKIPNNMDSAEMTTVLRAKVINEKFTEEEREWLRDASRMIEHLVEKVTQLEEVIKNNNNGSQTATSHYETDKIVDDAFNLVKFVKNNEYPPEGTSKFFEFTDLCHELECSLRKAGFEIKNNISINEN